MCRENRFEAGPISQDARAVILAQLGEAEAAMDEIERELRSPVGESTANSLRLDPRWDPIRERPRFKALLAKYANPRQPAR